MMSDFNGPHAYFNNSTHLPSSDDSSNKPAEVWSVFGDDSCGEPLLPQHIVIDFTPTDDDSDIVQKKVCSFWQFINNHPEIQHLKVKPDKDVYTEDSNTGIATVSSLAKGKNAKKIPDKQVLDMLEFAGEKKIIDTALNGKQSMCSLGSREYQQREIKTQPKKQEKIKHEIIDTALNSKQSMCSLGSRDYQQREIKTQPKKQDKIKHVCKCIPCRYPNCRNRKASSVSRDEISQIREVNRMMNKWDAEHPKCGHYQRLQNDTMDTMTDGGSESWSNDCVSESVSWNAPS